MEDLVQLVIFAIILILGLLSGSRRKRQQGQRPQSRQPVRRPSRQPAVRRGLPERAEPSAQASTAASRLPTPSPSARPRSKFEETLLDLLQQRIPEPERPEPVLPQPALPEAPQEEAQSLEQLNISADERHARFHERYVEARAAPGEHTSIRRRLIAGPQSLRDGVIWQAILGKPKGLHLP